MTINGWLINTPNPPHFDRAVAVTKINNYGKSDNNIVGPNSDFFTIKTNEGNEKIELSKKVSDNRKVVVTFIHDNQLDDYVRGENM